MSATVPQELPLEAELQQAIAHHQAGSFEQAEELYLGILQTQPYHAIANHNMGLLAGQVGQYEAGLPYLRKALSVNPDEGQFWLSYAAGLLKAGQPGEALEIAATAIKRGLDNPASQALRQQAEAALAEAAHAPSDDDIHAIVGLYNSGDYAQLESATRLLLDRYPESPFAWSVLGTALQAQGKDALAALQKTVELVPRDAEAHGNLGNAWQARGQCERAIASYLRALEIKPDFAEAHGNLGGALQALGRLAEAESSYRKALEIHPAYAMAHFNLGNTLKAQGNLEGAAASYRRALDLAPGDAETHSNLGNTLQALKQFDAAAASYRAALDIAPGYVIAHCNLGAALQDLGRFDEAVASYRRALEIEPAHAAAHNGLGLGLKALEQAEAAVAAFRRALELQPRYAAAQSNLASALFLLDRQDEAIALYRDALRRQPGSADAHSHLALALQSTGQLEPALALHRRAVELDPASASAHAYLGHALKQLRRFDEAVAIYRIAVQITPADPSLLNDLGIALQDDGKNEEAIGIYQQAIELNPEFFLAHCNQGVAQEALGQPDQARLCYGRALAIDPDSSRAHYNMGNCLRTMNQFEAALASYRRALEIQPDFVGSHTNLCTTLSEMGLIEEAAAACDAALKINPNYDLVHSNLLFCLSHIRSEPAALFAEHLRFAEQFEAPLRASWQEHGNGRDPLRRLRIGFVSGDLCHHPIAHFITPILEALSRFPSLSLHAYYNNTRVDQVTLRLRELLPDWHDIAHLSDDDLAQQIRDDGIDVLIDLSGHSAKHRLLTFARKPAPLQASWMGYPGTTGLQAMDYYLADRFLLPPGQFENQFTEKFAYLPASAPFLPAAVAPDVNPLPAQGNGHITFGSFNRVNKLSLEVIALWSTLLHALPDAHMLLGAMQTDGDHRILIDWFASQGIGRERLSFHPRTDMRGYLALHHQVDICLDTLPYTGGTTTLHGLWMGVPMLTLAGPTMPGRSSAAILGHVQLDAFIARDSDDFVKKGVYLANNLPLLAMLRASMRQLLERSALGQPALIAAGLEGALRAMWQRRCAGLPAESFEVEIDPGVAAADETAAPAEVSP